MKIKASDYNNFRYKKLGANYTIEQNSRCFAEFITSKFKNR